MHLSVFSPNAEKRDQNNSEYGHFFTQCNGISTLFLYEGKTTVVFRGSSCLKCSNFYKSNKLKYKLSSKNIVDWIHSFSLTSANVDFLKKLIKFSTDYSDVSSFNNYIFITLDFLPDQVLLKASASTIHLM